MKKRVQHEGVYERWCYRGHTPQIKDRSDSKTPSKNYPSNATTTNTHSMMRPNPPQHRLQRRVVVKPVPSLLVRYAKSVYDSLVRNGSHFLQGTHLTVSKCHPEGERGRGCAWSRGAARKKHMGAFTFLRAVSAWRRACSWPFCGLRPCRMDWRRWTH